MALAHLRFDECDDRVCRFEIDLGRNRYYAFTIGDGATDTRHGLRVLRNRSHSSRTLGPLDEAALGRGELEVPVDLFERDARSIQLLSYRTASREGPAVSPVVEVLASPRGSDGGSPDDGSLPPLGFSASMGRSAALMAIAVDRAVTSPRARHSHRRLRSRPSGHMSEAQFLGTLTSLLPQILPVAGQVLGSLFGGAGGGGGPATAAAGGAAGGGTGAPIIPPALLQALQQLLSTLGAARPAAGAPAAAPAPSVTSGAGAGGVVTTASRSARAVYAQSRNGGDAYSEAMILPLIPAILAALPALAPLITGIAELGLKAERQQLEHLRALNPGVDDPMLMGLLAQMSVEATQPAKPLRYRQIPAVRLAFADARTVRLGGREVVAYARGRDLEFPLALETPRSIPPGSLKLVVKHATTLEILAEQRVRTPQLTEGRLPVANRIPAEELAGLRVGEPYIACAHLVWKTKAGDRVGSTMAQPFTVVGDYTFDSVDESGELIPLNDVDRYRDFWHKVWQDSFSRELARIEFEAKYYYLLQPDQTDNAQLETTLSEVEHGLRRQVSRLRTGLLLSPNRLNELLPRISTHPSLPEDRLTALLTPDFVERLRLAARSRVKFGGRPGTSVALWVFPEVKVQRITLARTDDVAPSGNVVSLVPEAVHFPVPALAHFVGVASE